MIEDKYKATYTTISFSALEAVAKMVQQLQDERDALLKAVIEISTSEDSKAQRDAMDDAILLALSLEKS